MRHYKRVILSSVLAGFVMTMFGSHNEALAQNKRPYACEKPAVHHPPIRDYGKGVSKNWLAPGYLTQLVNKWDANYIRQGCQAFLDGKSWDDSCLNGRRPVEQIKKDVPKDFFALDNATAGKLLAKVKGNEAYLEALAFCRANGIYTKAR